MLEIFAITKNISMIGRWEYEYEYEYEYDDDDDD